MIVMKFGGSSLKDDTRIREVKEIISARIKKRPIIVLSAMGKTTDGLIAAGRSALAGKVNIEDIRKNHYTICEKLDVDKRVIQDLFDELNDLLVGISLIKELTPKTHDYLVSFGERLSVRIMASFLDQNNLPSKAFDAWEIGMVTDSCSNNAGVLKRSYQDIRNFLSGLEKNYTYTPIITGFIGKDKSGMITTLGRGGSDLSASVIGASVDAEEIQVWKDVDGILTADPRVVKGAKPVGSVSFEEASELAYFGAKVLHPRSILPAMKQGITVRVKNSYNPDHPGTAIKESLQGESGLMRAITFKKGITVVDLVSTRMLGQYGFLAGVFSIFDEEQISVDMVATSEVSVSMTLDEAGKDFSCLIKKLEKIANVEIKKDKSIITLIGTVRRSSEILEKTFGVLVDNGINVQMISQGASKVNISFIVDEDQTDLCVKRLHSLFFEV